jgi:hypothetical protein
VNFSSDYERSRNSTERFRLQTSNASILADLSDVPGIPFFQHECFRVNTECSWNILLPRKRSRVPPGCSRYTHFPTRAFSRTHRMFPNPLQADDLATKIAILSSVKLASPPNVRFSCRIARGQLQISPTANIRFLYLFLYHILCHISQQPHHCKYRTKTFYTDLRHSRIHKILKPTKY